ncbi:MAG: hypothetical protein L0I76_19655 [Pseudonocardia sp.]|nr:hypothetical protein [Pseudonocardia sp.]
MTTAAGVRGVPSWNVTFGRSTNRQVRGPVCAHSVASDGRATPSAPEAISDSETPSWETTSASSVSRP